MASYIKEIGVDIYGERKLYGNWSKPRTKVSYNEEIGISNSRERYMERKPQTFGS